MISRKILMILMGVLCGQANLSAEESDYDKTPFALEVRPEDSSADVAEQLEALLAQHRHQEGVLIVGKVWVPSPRMDNTPPEPPSGPGPRPYSSPLTEQEKNDITYIVHTLSSKPTPVLLFHKGSLEEAGDRIDRVHPLRFLEAIFSIEQNKAEIRNIRKKSWVWKDFTSGLFGSLNEESALENLTDDMVRDFSKTVGIDPKHVLLPVHQKNWPLLVDNLIRYIPRKGDPGRYGM